MGTQKVHCRGGAQHARPCGSCSAPGSMTSIDPYMQKRMLASAETKEKPLAERIGKGLSLVRGTGLEPGMCWNTGSKALKLHVYRMDL